MPAQTNAVQHTPSLPCIKGEQELKYKMCTEKPATIHHLHEANVVLLPCCSMTLVMQPSQPRPRSFIVRNEALRRLPLLQQQHTTLWTCQWRYKRLKCHNPIKTSSLVTSGIKDNLFQTHRFAFHVLGAAVRMVEKDGRYPGKLIRECHLVPT